MTYKWRQRVHVIGRQTSQCVAHNSVTVAPIHTSDLLLPSNGVKRTVPALSRLRT